MFTQVMKRLVFSLAILSLQVLMPVRSESHPRVAPFHNRKTTNYPRLAPNTLYGAALATVADYVAARGEASKADVLAGKWFRPAKPEMPSDMEDSGNYIADKRVSLKPPRLTKNNSAYSVYFSRGRSGLYEVFKIRRYPGDPNQRTEDLPFTSR